MRIGEKVAIEPGFPCRTWGECNAGRSNLCAGVRFYAAPPIDGTFAEYVVAQQISPIPCLGQAMICRPLVAASYASSVFQWACR